MRKTKRLPLLRALVTIIVALTVPPTIIACGLFAFVETAGRVPDGYEESLSATIRADTMYSGNGATTPTWGTTLHPQASKAALFAARSYRWQYSLDRGSTWITNAEDSETISVTPTMTGLLWRYRITDQFASGKKITFYSKPYGPIQPKTAALNPKGDVASVLEPGNYLFIDTDAPRGAALSYRWQRALAASGSYEDVIVTDADRYFIRKEDTGYTFRCIVGGTLEGYAIEGGTVDFDGVIQNPRNIGTLPPGPDLADAQTRAAAVEAAYVCGSAGDGWYHTYDCDVLSHQREQGFSVQELPLDQARRLYRPCPYCQPGA